MAETTSFIERINTLATRRKNDSLTFDIFQTSTFFNRDSIDNWSLKIDSLCNDLKQLQDNDAKYNWFKSLFMEIFNMITHENFKDLPINVSDIAQLLNKLCSLCDVTTVKTVGKLFISVSSVLPQFINNPINETKLVELTELAEPIHMEIFKFSWLSSKLSERKQTILLRHFLKKSKYELHKFNLFSENATGFAQLSILFTTYYGDSTANDPEHINYFVNEMYHVMGKYSLESMRCLDVFLLVSSEYILDHYMKCISFLKRTDFIKHAPSNITKPLNNVILSQVILFNLEQNQNVQQNYWNLISILIKFGFIDVKQLWNNLSPDHSTLSDCLIKLETILEKESMKGVDNPLAMAAALTNDEDSNDTDLGGSDDLKNVDQDLDIEISDLPKEPTKNDKDSALKEIDTWKSSNKIQLLKNLLIHGCLDEVIPIIREQPNLLLLDIELVGLLSRCIDVIIDPLYKLTPYRSKINDSKLRQSLLITTLDDELMNTRPRLFKTTKQFDIETNIELNVQSVFYFPEWSNSLQRLESIDDLFKFSHEYLDLLGPHLSASPALIIKLSRIGINDINNDPSDDGTVLTKWIDYTRKFILPTVSLYEQNTVVSTEVYNLLRLFPFERRYFMYNEVLTKLSQDSLVVKIGFNKAEREAKSTLKALSIDTIAKESRNLSNIISSNPLATLLPAVKQVENYDKVSELLIYTTRFFNEFSYDVLQYVLLARLTYQRSAVQFDGVNQAPWVQRLAIFIAGLAKNCAQMDLSNIITYIIKTLHHPDDKSNIIAVTILKELIITVGGIRDQNEVTFKSLIMLNSGDPLKQEARKLIYDFRDANKEAAQNLISLFVRQNSISEIILLLYNLNGKANTADAHYKVLSSRCDEMNTLLWSFIELVKYCCKDNKFVENVLPFQELTNKFHISAPWAFNIWRDYIDEKENKPEENNLAKATQTSFDDILEKATFPDVAFTHVSRDLVTSFWKLSLYDIYLDKPLYDELKEKLEEVEKKESSNRKRNIISNKIKKILVTFISHQRAFNNTKSILDRKVQSWLQGFESEEIKSFLQYAIIPRVLFSPSDAIYSAFFILHSFEIVDVSRIFDSLVNSKILETLLFSCTSAEAGNLGTFFFTLVESFEKSRRENNEAIDSSKRTIYDWHSNIVKQLVNCLSAKNYMSIRNGIEFMKHISSVFPVIDTHLSILCLLLKENLISEEREDIKLPTNALLGHLKARLKNTSVKLHEFCELTEEEQKEKEQYESELEEIKQYESAYANEQKEIEIRQKLEMNKLQRAKKQQETEAEKGKKNLSLDEKLSRLPKAPSSTNLSSATKESAQPKPEDVTSSKPVEWRLAQVERCMEDVMLSLEVNKVEGACLYIPDAKVQEALKQLVHEKGKPLKEYRDDVFTVLKTWFTSLVHYPNNPDFIKLVNALENATTYISNQDLSSMEDMYGDTTPVPKKSSRYNNNTDTSASTVTQKEKGESKSIEMSPLPTQPSASNATQNRPNKNTQAQSLKQSQYSISRSVNNSRDSSAKPAEKRYQSGPDSRGPDASSRVPTFRDSDRYGPPKGPSRDRNFNAKRFDNPKDDHRYSNKNDRYSGKEERFAKKEEVFTFKRTAPPRDYEPPNKKRNVNSGPQRDYHQYGSSQPQPARNNRYDDKKSGRGARTDNRNSFPQGPRNSGGSRYQR